LPNDFAVGLCRSGRTTSETTPPGCGFDVECDFRGTRDPFSLDLRKEKRPSHDYELLDEQLRLQMLGDFWHIGSADEAVLHKHTGDTPCEKELYARRKYQLLQNVWSRARLARKRVSRQL